MFIGWFGGHWFELLQTAGIVVSIFVAAHTMRDETRTRRVENWFHVAREYRGIWSELYRNPKLKRVLAEHLDPDGRNVTMEEEMFTQFLILHLQGVYHAARVGMFPKFEGLHEDVRQFFSRPIPQMVWERSKPFQNKEFVAFVESCLAEKA